MLPREAETAGRAAALSVQARLPALPAPEAAPTLPPSLSLVARAVSNWREEAGQNLAPTSLALVVRYAATEPGFVARCVRLNNYWCVKQARWSGELGGDAEGHTGFATAADGADAAAGLLRRYYRDYGRRTALAIVRRWAPAECGAPRPVARSVPRGGTTAPAVSAGLAPQGIGRTLRARFLARHGRGGVARALPPVAGSLRVQPWSARARLAGHPGRAPRAAALPPLRPTADIVTGLKAASAAPAPRAVTDPAAVLASSRPLDASRLTAEAAALPALAALPKGSLLDLSVPAPLCSGDETRIRNYAARIAGSVGMGSEDDLRLFDGDGRAGANLLPVLRAMSAVELGTLHAAPALIAAAVERLQDRQAVRANAEPMVESDR
ncbi:hypothetical protein [Methylobacterium sp. Leaf456]|uniref:hypothetical protein n=1 Tax=Methylobacterium sp. Leaf456 TaxID=1736382 RepID=UPI000A8205F1|nr:hypothetical protein [Methylobacterium sp. Leaf456]